MSQIFLLLLHYFFYEFLNLKKQTLVHFRPIYVIFPTLFQTWPKIPYPISDQVLPISFA